jgi:predicted alpha/beta-hydrolase family hydrolase
MTPTKHRIDLPGLTFGQRAVNAMHDAAEQPRATVVFLPRFQLDQPFAVRLAALLPTEGIELWRFVLPGLARATRLPSSEEQGHIWRTVLEVARSQARTIIAASEGRTCRALSELVASEPLVDGLALFSYPFHAYEQPTQRHTKHFADIAVPTLLCSKDNDLEAIPSVVREEAASMANVTVSIIERPAPDVFDYFEPTAALALVDFVNAVVALL